MDNKAYQQYINSGGTVKQLPAHEKPTKNPPNYGKPLENCTLCNHYKNGNGDKLCLKCKQYNEFKVKSTSRPQIVLEHLPQMLLEAIEDRPQLHNIIDTLRKLPLERSTPILQQYLLNASLSEIAKYHQSTKQRFYAKNKSTLVIIKKITQK